LAKPNYQYEKRQRELAKKAKKAEKAARKTTGGPSDEPEALQDGAAQTDDTAAPDAGQAGAPTDGRVA
jgi:hypothetical protein